MTPHSCILAWRIPRTEEPGGLVHRAAGSDQLSELARTSLLLLLSC